ncbi:Cytochrome b561 and DOMON domain-containing protein [Hibiscus syriacus]|uniref:Cytochrome b561 and DOMON domain-containing protein n=1 Tax=Hibiscus syriacus TaxID=106335 RepID=A0A6A2ZCK2_HIBSY|nr:Cytochrome b561 and DOMON domain-containing protein [Hibiscus syriacus]
MVGSQALVAYRMSDGSMRVYTSPIAQYQTQLHDGELSLDVSDLSAAYGDNEIIIFATLGISDNWTTLNHVWQGGAMSGNTPQMHAASGANIQSMGTLNLVSGEDGTIGGGSSIQRKQEIHGVLNAVSWAILIPLGAMIARYLKVFKSADPAWFYLHASCQFSAYVIGVAGWGTGLKLGSESPGIQYNAHRTIGIILFCLGTLQYIGTDKSFDLDLGICFASKAKIRSQIQILLEHISPFGGIYCHNPFKGFDILEPEKKWKNAYIGLVVALACNAVMLEVYTWFFLQRKRSEGEEKTPYGIDGVNGHGAKP